MSSARRIVWIEGEDREGFLQDLVSNDIRPQGRLVWSALLSPQGKYLADFLTLNTGERILLDVAEPLADDLLRRLGMYRLRRKVSFTPAGLHVSRGTGDAPEGALADPRHPALGWRLYGAAQGDDGSDWDAIRVAHCVPETGVELIPGESYPLETAMDRLHGIDFRKGCYVGQEVTARMKHKTALRKGLATVTLDGPAEPGTPIMSGDKPAGMLHTRAGNRAIAYLRFDRTDGPLTAGTARVLPDAAPGA